MHRPIQSVLQINMACFSGSPIFPIYSFVNPFRHVFPQAGQFLADGFYAAVWVLPGDQDYKRDCLLLPNVTSACPCSNCPANQIEHDKPGGMPWFDWRPQEHSIGNIGIGTCLTET